jgi:hypothetical protein
VEISAQRVTPLDWDGDKQQSSYNKPQPQSGPAPRDIEEPIPDDDIPF